MSNIITVNDLCLWYGNTQALKNVNINIAKNSITALIGPSGCGKSTFLKTLNRMNDLVPGVRITGEVKYDGKDIFSPGTDVNELRKNIGMVFQSYAVWPHMTVFENVAYPLKIKKVNRNVIKDKVDRILDVVHLSQYADRIPSQLSGGQQQRVALGRALVAEL